MGSGVTDLNAFTVGSTFVDVVKDNQGPLQGFSQFRASNSKMNLYRFSSVPPYSSALLLVFELRDCSGR